jgi:hypothetical protein
MDEGVSELNFDRKINACKPIQTWGAGNFENNPCFVTERNIFDIFSYCDNILKS